MLFLLPLFVAALVAAKTQKFISRPDLEAVKWNVTYNDDSIPVADGYIFMSPLDDKALGLHIFTQDGDLVYVNNTGPAVHGSDFKVQTLGGNPVLSFWQGDFDNNGYSIKGGTDYILSMNYTQLANTSTSNNVDLHEFSITVNDTALETFYHVINATGLHTAPRDIKVKDKGYVVDSGFQETNPLTGEILFVYGFHKEGVNFSDSYNTIKKVPKDTDSAWDWIHVNSVQKDELGNYLVSARHLHTVFYISPEKKILWRLGGKQSDFKILDGVDFAWQHNVRFADEQGMNAADLDAYLADGKRRITLFDNHAGTVDTDKSAHSGGKLIELDFNQRTASLVQAYDDLGNGRNVLTSEQGSVQLIGEFTNLDTDHVMVGFGGYPAFAEYTKDGKPIRVVEFGKNGKMTSYRIYKNSWQGLPLSPPDGVINNGTLYVSWNGATDVAKWAVIQGDNVTEVDKTGFETKIPLGQVDSLQVEARDINGKALAKSDTITP